VEATEEEYLLDNNIISILIRPGDERYPSIRSKFEALHSSKIHLPVIAVAEIEFGLEIAPPGSNEAQVLAFREFINRYPKLGIGVHTIEPYFLLRAQIWRDHATPKKKRNGYEEKRPEELEERASGKSLGIDERDLLIAGIAVEYRLVLVTNDQKEGMKRIERAANKLEADGRPIHLRIEYWRK
jgi:predicted nucleic acid-binding protein